MIEDVIQHENVINESTEKYSFLNIIILIIILDLYDKYYIWFN